MYERMLDKRLTPQFEDMASYCGASSSLFKGLNYYLASEFGTQTKIRFPYGNQYGWGVKHSKGSRHICDIFPESMAFSVMLRLNNKQIKFIYDDLLEYSKYFIDNKYPCGDGGWIHYRVIYQCHLNDIKKLLNCKMVQ